MTEKNRKKKEARKYRVFFSGKLGTQIHESEKHPNREKIKKETRRILIER